jgi:hypothetical protein
MDTRQTPSPYLYTQVYQLARILIFLYITTGHKYYKQFTHSDVILQHNSLFQLIYKLANNRLTWLRLVYLSVGAHSSANV